MSQREVYQKIRNAITFGELKPGERLVESRICDIFHVGRTPLREALRQLQMEGYVDALSNKGAIVKRVSVRDVEEIYDILAMLEGYATEVATMYIGKAEKEKLESMQKEMKSIYKDIRNDLKKHTLMRSYNEWFEKNASFHSYFVKANGNLHLSEIINSLRDRTFRCRFVAISIPNQIEAYIRAHDEILKAVFKGRGKQAGEAMRRHVFNAKKILIKSLKESPWLL